MRPTGWLDWLAGAGLMAACGLIGAGGGRDLNWDQLNYHVYVAHAWLTGRHGNDFNAASVLTYVNPLAHVPFYLAAMSPLPSWTAAFLIGFFQGLAVAAVYAAARIGLSERARCAPLAAACVALIGATQPVVAAELGSSLVEVTAAIPIIVATCLLLWVRRSRPAHGVSMLLLAALFAGAGSALKLPLAPFSAILCLLLILSWPRPMRSVDVLAFGFAVALGWFVAGGFWHLWLWSEFGNPFFPFFNDFFRSPDYPPQALANERFLRRSLVAVASFPFEMLQVRRFVTVETAAVDPRYALFLFALAAAAVWRLWRPRVSGAAIALGEQRAMLVAVAAFVVGFVLWAVLSGNGRYAMPLHLLSGLAIAAAVSLAGATARAVTLVLALVAFICIVLWYSLGEMTHWTRVRHAERWYTVALPERHISGNALYLSAAYMDRSSKSFLVPWLPATARFANVGGYAYPAADSPLGRRIRRLIEGHSGPIYLLTEAPPAGRKRQLEDWLQAARKNLASYGVAVTTDCAPVRVDLGEPKVMGQDSEELGSPPTHALLCLAHRTPPVDHRLAMTREEAAFDELEREMPQMLYPAGSESYFRGQGYCRFYVPREYYLCAGGGKLTLAKIDPPQVFLSRPWP